MLPQLLAQTYQPPDVKYTFLSPDLEIYLLAPTRAYIIKHLTPDNTRRSFRGCPGSASPGHVCYHHHRLLHNLISRYIELAQHSAPYGKGVPCQSEFRSRGSCLQDYSRQTFQKSEMRLLLNRHIMLPPYDQLSRSA